MNLSRVIHLDPFVGTKKARRTGPSLAGQVTDYSNTSLEHLAAALNRFASPEAGEKTLEELNALFCLVSSSENVRPVTTPKIHDAARRLGAERVSELVAKYEAGAPAQTLANEFNIGSSTVLRLVRTAGGRVRRHGVEDEVRDEARRLYESGLSVQKVADRLGLTQSTTLRTLTRAGVTMRMRKNLPRA
ncbi:hypothetical protein [Herbiconiux liangxiaofengii]|uniref:hypothetical protein n=1 Tax=Herbiconiux liangxiaofengii TaxID=3342795 RepID=UPI0035B8068E